MEITPLQLTPVQGSPSVPMQAVLDAAKSAITDGAEPAQNFQQLLAGALDKTNQLQEQADDLVKKLAAGEKVELHQVMIASEKAGLALDMTMQVRNKILDAYTAIMNMQI